MARSKNFPITLLETKKPYLKELKKYASKRKESILCEMIGKAEEIIEHSILLNTKLQQTTLLSYFKPMQ